MVVPDLAGDKQLIPGYVTGLHGLIQCLPKFFFILVQSRSIEVAVAQIDGFTHGADEILSAQLVGSETHQRHLAVIIERGLWDTHVPHCAAL